MDKLVKAAIQDFTKGIYKQGVVDLYVHTTSNALQMKTNIHHKHNGFIEGHVIYVILQQHNTVIKAHFPQLH